VSVIGVVRVRAVLPNVGVAETFGVEFVAELGFGFHARTSKKL
jgi:hypothetical protein